MFEFVQASPKEIAVVYLVVVGACFSLLPLSLLVVEAIKGVRRWR